jgi:hypothetical protein
MVSTLASSRLKPVPLIDRMPTVGLANLDCGTGFSRESVGSHAAKLMAHALASSRLKPVLRIDRVPIVGPRTHCRTGFSRENVGSHTAKLMAHALASSRLKPVPLIDRVPPVGLANPDCGTDFSRENVGSHAAELMVSTLASSRLKTHQCLGMSAATASISINIPSSARRGTGISVHTGFILPAHARSACSTHARNRSSE